MGWNVTQKPNRICGCNSPIIIIAEGTGSDAPTDASLYKYRYVLKIDIDGVEKAVLKVYPNASNVGVFDISHIVKSFLSIQYQNAGAISTGDTPEGTIHSIGKTVNVDYLFSQTDGPLAKVEVRFFYESATSMSASPTLSSEQTDITLMVIEAGTPFEKGINVSPLNNNQPLYNNIFYLLGASGNDQRFLTNAPIYQYVRGSDYGQPDNNLDQFTFAFLQKCAPGVDLNDDVVDVHGFRIKYYEPDGTLLTNWSISNYSSNGGSPDATTNTVQESYLYFACGTYNLENQTEVSAFRPSVANNNNWSYYTVEAFNFDDSDETRISYVYYFIRYDNPPLNDFANSRHQCRTGYDNVRVAWKNRLGAWDYFNFRGKSTETVNIESNESESVAGTWNDASFVTNTWDRGKKTLFTSARKRISINSDWLNETEAIWLEELFTSTEVQILLDPTDTAQDVTPVVITDRRYVKKTVDNDKIKIQYTINLEYANPINTNS